MRAETQTHGYITTQTPKHTDTQTNTQTPIHPDTQAYLRTCAPTYRHPDTLIRELTNTLAPEHMPTQTHTHADTLIL